MDVKAKCVYIYMSVSVFVRLIVIVIFDEQKSSGQEFGNLIKWCLICDV